MVSIRALLAGLTGISLCMANISGTVTNTGTTPIAGVVVQLEKGGQTATTGADGSFTIVVGSVGILPGNGKSLPNGLSAGISGDLMIVTILERSAVEVAAFDLNGKAISKVRQTMETGTHTIALPQRGAGVYLYKVKSGNRELVLKGNTVGGASSGSTLSLTDQSSNRLAKQAKATALLSDVIVAKKANLLNYRCVIGNSDTSGIVIKMIASAGTVTDADGNVYQTVRIGNQVWMTENLRVTKYSDGATAIPQDTSTATWAYAKTPKYCYYNNTKNADSIKNYGVLYNWHVVSPTNPKKIAPTGWHVPSDAEWDTLQNCLITTGYNWDGTITGNKIAKSLAAKTDWYTFSITGRIGCDLTKNNRSGFSALPGGCRSNDGIFYALSYDGFWWSATGLGAPGALGRVLYSSSDDLLRYDSSHESSGFSVRLVRD